jgi:two-component system nitrate/nitrite response regulator NarL
MLDRVHAYLLRQSISQAELIREILLLVARLGVVVADSIIAERFWSLPGRPIIVHVPSPAILTPREVEVLTWATRGETDKQIANRLSVSDTTVEYHVQRASQKLDATSRVQLGWLLHERGLL